MIFLTNILVISIVFSGCNVLEKNQHVSMLMNKITPIQPFSNNVLAYQNKQYKHIVQKGENITSLLIKSGVNTKDIFTLIKKDNAILNNIQPNQELYWKTNEFNELLELKWIISPLKKKIYKKNNHNFIMVNNVLKDDLIYKNIFIKKKSNFFSSASKIGLNQHDIMNVVQAFKWQVNFHKLNIGSVFHIVFLHNFQCNKNILLGVKLNNAGKTYYSIRACNGHFYDINGCNKQQKWIDLSLLKKYRISSKFNLHRLHPVTHHVSRHLGIDLAMPKGTPIFSTTNGKIIKTHFDKISGFYIVLKHDDFCITRYMHLKKILVKQGDNVKIGQKIALSGNTGRTTGPHLHYEIWINNQAVDPLNVKNLFCDTLTEKEKKIYINDSKKIVFALNTTII